MRELALRRGALDCSRGEGGISWVIASDGIARHSLSFIAQSPSNGFLDALVEFRQGLADTIPRGPGEWTRAPRFVNRAEVGSDSGAIGHGPRHTLFQALAMRWRTIPIKASMPACLETKPVASESLERRSSSPSGRLETSKMGTVTS